MRRARPRILAISSGGGHWVELLRLRPALEGAEVFFATVDHAYSKEVPGERFFVIRDATRWNKAALLLLLVEVAILLVRVRPDRVITTGAAPGYFAVRLARFVGARSLWLDSIANVDELSLSGQMAGKSAEMWLTQWEHLGRPEGPHYRGGVL